ncbi:hypothetical protein MHYP_G00170240 [Metynnis hypsauchen]
MFSEVFLETLHQSEKEGNTVALKCGRLTKGPVTWSRDTNGQRVDILTTHNGETTKHIADPDRRLKPNTTNLILYALGTSSITTSSTVEGAARTTTTPITKRRTTKATETATTTEGLSGGTASVSVLWSFLIIAGSCLVAVVLVPFPWRCFHKRKEDCEMLYDDVYTTIEYVAFNKEQSGAVCVQTP